MQCPCCSKEIDSYLHVLAVDANKFNYCCSDCLAERLRVPLLKNVKFALTDEDKEEIQQVARNEIEKHWLRLFEPSIK